MPKGTKKTKSIQDFAKDVAEEILGDAAKVDKDTVKGKIDEEVEAAFESISKYEQSEHVNFTNPQFKKWDIKINEKVTYFDPLLTYEITGYRPIDETRGLDFKPEWFTETREVKLKTGKYCTYPPGTKKYADFWNEEFRRCNEGYVSHGYRLTGDHYFFLNFYKLKSTQTKVAGQGRKTSYPDFFSKQYEYFHYIDLCRATRHDACALKARGVGFSEIAACLGVRMYSTVRGSNCIYVAYTDKYVRDVLGKCWEQLDFLNNDTEGGMRHARQAKNSDMVKRASLLNKAREEFGFMSEIAGTVADKPSKLRGDRVDLLLFEEAGSNPVLLDTYIQSRALVEILGDKFGIRVLWGTGGDQGALEGLKEIFYNPEGYQVLPYRHNYTQSGDFVDTGFFIPSFTACMRDNDTGEVLIDSRGVTNTEKAKAYYNRTNLRIKDPQKQIKDKAEFCFTPEDALALDGDNLFDRVILTQQKAAIELHKIGPHIDVGVMEWNLEGHLQKAEAIKGVFFKPDPTGHVQILEHPIKDQGANSTNLYVAGIDGIDLGQEDTSNETRDPSQMAVVILKRSNGLESPKIVAVYKDRPQKLRDAHLQVLRLLWYYNCKAIIESTRLSLLTFFREWGLQDRFLMRRPSSCQTDSSISKQFGAQASEHVIKHQIELIQGFVQEFGYGDPPITDQQLDQLNRERVAQGLEKLVQKPLEGLWFADVINELLNYKYVNKGKFDYVAAMGMCLLGDEELTLRGMKPKFEKPQDNKIKPFGYWIDEKGYRHKGKIPEIRRPQPIANWTVVGDGRLNGRTSKSYD